MKASDIIAVVLDPPDELAARLEAGEGALLTLSPGPVVISIGWDDVMAMRVIGFITEYFEMLRVREVDELLLNTILWQRSQVFSADLAPHLAVKAHALEVELERFGVAPANVERVLMTALWWLHTFSAWKFADEHEEQPNIETFWQSKGGHLDQALDGG